MKNFEHEQNFGDPPEVQDEIDEAMKRFNESVKEPKTTLQDRDKINFFKSEIRFLSRQDRPSASKIKAWEDKLLRFETLEIERLRRAEAEYNKKKEVALAMARQVALNNFANRKEHKEQKEKEKWQLIKEMEESQREKKPKQKSVMWPGAFASNLDIPGIPHQTSRLPNLDELEGSSGEDDPADRFFKKD